MISTAYFGPVLDNDHPVYITLPQTIRNNLEDHTSYLMQSEMHATDNPHSAFVSVNVIKETQY